VSERMSGKVVLVSGSARGIGAATARAVVREGGNVILGDVLSEEVEHLADELGDAAVCMALDVTSAEQWQAAVALAEQSFGRLDILINNAGIGHRPHSIENIKVEEWDRVIAINLTGAFHGIQAAVPAMRRAGGGSIVNVSSIAGLQSMNGTSAYSASKFGLRGLTKAAAIDLGRYGIRVNSVHPGPIATPMMSGITMPLDHQALPRLGTAEEIAAMIVFLASDESLFSTGSEFIADGGTSAGRVFK
jgi:3alpha(or 20beta)-hydroxysteroid dehydrogenase